MALGIDGQVTLPSGNQVFGDDKLDVFERMGAKCAPTDFAILLGVTPSIIHVDDDRSLKGRTGSWCLSSAELRRWDYHYDEEGFVENVSYEGKRGYNNRSSMLDQEGVRLVIPYKNYDDFTKYGRLNRNGISEIEMGEYPQYTASKRMNKKLETAFNNGTLKKTGKTYTVEVREGTSYQQVVFVEYEYEGKKYVRVKSRTNAHLSNNVNINAYDNVWIEVSPVTWLVDYNNKVLICKNLLVPAVKYTKMGEYFGDFDSTYIKSYINNILIKDIFSEKKIEEVREQAIEEKEKEDTSTIEGMIERIKSILPYYPNREKIMDYLKQLIGEHNKKINELVRSNREKKINLNLETPEMVYNKTMEKLKTLYEKLKKYYNLIKKYNALLDTVEDSIKLLNQKDYNSLNNALDKVIDRTLDGIALDESDKEGIKAKALSNVEKNKVYNDVTRIFDGIGSVILPFLEETERKEILSELNAVLEKYKKEIKDYIDSLSVMSEEKGKALEYNSLEELELSIRRDINDILLKMQFYVNRRDLIEEINQGMADAINNAYKEGKYKTLKWYFKYVNDRVKSINSKIALNEKEYSFYRERMEKILNVKIDNNMDIEEINKKLFEISKELCSIEYDLDKDIEMGEYFVSSNIL